MHHHRKRSGHGVPNNVSATDVRKTVTATDSSTKYKRPTMTRRHTPQKLGRNPREREREWSESWDDERESFPQFCMTCEKQFVPHDDMFLYCSEHCRRVDQNSTSQAASSVGRTYVSTTSYPLYASGNPEPKDIIPRASPSRPSSMTFHSPPATPGTATYQTSAISALRSLTVRPPSPPSPTGSSNSLWPFTRSAATSPTSSYTRPSAGYFSSTYDGGYQYYGGGGNAYTSSGSNYDVAGAGAGMGMGMDRPLPSRHPGAYSRPKSIELVTPMVGR